MAEDSVAEAFKLFDLQHDGVIDQHELLRIAQDVDSPLTQKEISDMVRMASGGGDAVTLDHFKAFMSGSAPAFAPTEDVIKAFETVADDPANPGKIRLKVAMEMLQNIGNKLTPEELEKFEQDAQAFMEGDSDSVDFVRLSQAWTKAESMTSTQE